MLQKAKAFLENYAARHEQFTQAAADAQVLIEETIANLPFHVNQITSRAKSTKSLKEKLARKRYRNPASEITDLIGVRVVTYYSDQIDAVTSALARELRVFRRLSVDKRQALNLREFGYRSVHLIVKPKSIASGRFSALGNRRFEVQVRSLLDHAWASIEHEIVYKSGITYPEAFQRRFASLAGAL